MPFRGHIAPRNSNQASQFICFFGFCVVGKIGNVAGGSVGVDQTPIGIPMNFEVIPELAIELGQVRCKGSNCLGFRFGTEEFSDHY